MTISKEMMDSLFEKREVLYKEVKKIDQAISTLQEICEHDYIGDGHDSHRDHFKCKICKDTYSI